ncbi:NAD(P)/FAD-dependent oxidoreductase [Marinobacterium rhizophilum]|uniref:FAD-binding oxidoreductase n=1 Tax=Marinobacterium rhizophilum TaxID=420402 RepID=A0ABY5HQU6_9GAMM|nr:FAD-binding oxidoreductase [Marinobacterium rhizophilum]UTW13550.1 FAD-binding oxidoreductase [Marinobacterium rhizophilum]
MQPRNANVEPGNRNDTLAVVGAGVVGLCTALQAQRQGFRVTLIDREEPGTGASFGNAGYLATELVEPLSSAKTLRSALSMWLNPDGPLALPLGYLHRIMPWLVRFVVAARPAQVARSRQGLLALNLGAVPAWQRCLDDIGAGGQLCRSGYLLVWESASGLEDARRHAESLQRYGMPTELVQGARLAELEPALAGRVNHALYFPEACQVREPYRLCQLLFAAFQARGGSFLQQEVAALRPESHGVVLETGAGCLDFDRAIVCTGAWGKRLLQGVGVRVPLQAERGYHLSFAAASTCLRRPIGSAERRFVMSPLDSGLRAVGFTELGGLKLKPVRRRYASLRRHSQALLPGLSDPAVEVREWMGHRPTLPDSLPVIDRHPQHERLLFAFGNQHLGLTQAAISAELVVSLMQGTPPPIDPAPYRVTRFH